VASDDRPLSGYLSNAANPDPAATPAIIAGTLQANVPDAGLAPPPLIGTARRNVFGWVAQITEVL
jgi:hypothetical protein